MHSDYGIGFCQPYRGTTCSQFLQNRSIYVRNLNYQSLIEAKIGTAFSVIASSPDVSVQCNRYAISSLCHYAFPLCDDSGLDGPFPRKVCRDECELLEMNMCRMEHTIAKKHPLIGQAGLLPNCSQLPPIGTPESERCVRLGIPQTVQIDQSTCYQNRGKDYRGTASVTIYGKACAYWSQQIFYSTVEYPELIGHNYCRNPDGKDAQPWCYNAVDSRREYCDIPKCCKFLFSFSRKIFTNLSFF